MINLNRALDSPKDLKLSLFEVHRATKDLNGKAAKLASFDAPFACSCEGSSCWGCYSREGR